MNKNIPDIKYTKGITNPTVDSKNSNYELPMLKDAEYFSVLENFVSFIKNVEKLFRQSDEYKRYIAYLKNTVGLTRCQVHGNIEEGENESLIEMHHGPCLTLFDIVSIIVDDQLKRDKKISTFMICDLVSEEHFNNNVQVVMLSKTDHELVHTRDIFIHYNQAFGDLEKFLKKYKAGISVEILYKIKKYINFCKENDYFTNEILSLNKTISRWDERLEQIYY